MSHPSTPIYNDRYQANRREREAVLICCAYRHSFPYETAQPQASTVEGQLKSALFYAESASGMNWREFTDRNTDRTNRRERMAAAADRLRAKLAEIGAAA